jgi:hypothetical protein
VVGYYTESYKPKPWVYHYEESPHGKPEHTQPLGGILPTSRSEKQLLLLAAGVVGAWFVFVRKSNGRTLWDKWTGKRKNPRRMRRNPLAPGHDVCIRVGDKDAQLLGSSAFRREALGLPPPHRHASERLRLLKGRPANDDCPPAKKPRKARKAAKPKKAKKAVAKKTSPAQRRKPRSKKGGWKNKPAACRVKLPKKPRSKK